MAAFPEIEAGEAPPPTAFPTGEGRFETAAVLGRGGMGTVYVARDGQFGRDVALKEMSGEAASAEAVRRFLVEALVTGNLEHPGIPAVYERGVRAGKPFYAMRKVEGRTLASAAKKARTWEERLALLPSVVQVAHTLGFAHERGVVHRDVKPDNVVLGDHGETILLDWGIARVRGATFDGQGGATTELDAKGTVAGAVMGTPAYMAPEQAAGRVDAIDERTDVFALGAMLYHVLTGSPPYEGPTGVAVLTAALEGRRTPILKAAPRTPPALSSILDVAMATDPAQRYPNAGAFADALQAFLTSRVQERPSRVIGAMGTALGLLVIALAAVAVTGVGTATSSIREQGFTGYLLVTLTVLSAILAGIEWRTAGRNHLAPLLLAFAGITALGGFAGLFAGLGRLAQGAATIPEGEPVLDLVLVGLWEASGTVPFGTVLASIQLVLWALVRRRALLARDARQA